MTSKIETSVIQTAELEEKIPVEEYFFEGAEKLLELWFGNTSGRGGSLRRIPRYELDAMLNIAKCKILHSAHTEFIDSYVLSESSLFVSERRLILKTCGRTRLLAALPTIIQLAADYAGFDQVVSVYYSRKNFLRPELQPEEHRSFDAEVDYLDHFFHDGHAYCMGSLKQDRWYLYTYHVPQQITKLADHTMEILMTHLDEDVLNIFTKDSCENGKDCTERAGIDHIVPNGSLIHEELFDPCGYSMNAFLPQSDHYATIHVTPEKEFSFASFETNQDLICLYKQAKEVLKCFRPGKLLMTVFANDDSAKGREAQQQLWDRELPGYKRTNVQFVRLEKSVGHCPNALENLEESPSESTAKSPELTEGPIMGRDDEAPTSMLRLAGLLVTFATATLVLYFIWSIAPPSDSPTPLAFPKDLDALRELADLLEQYKNAHLAYVVLLFGYAYLYKQTFAIPGSFFLNLLAGALFGVYYGSVFVCILNATGASFCYILSQLFMRPIVDRCFSQRLMILRRKIILERQQLFMFLLGARILPFCPHWLLNICSPFVGVSLPLHASTVLIGLIPYNVLCVRAGRVLADVRSVHDVFDLTTILELVVLAIVLVIIGLLSRRRRRNQTESSHTSFE
ncbi:hypothetical protein GCK32_000565 [Trichostrongylus colubriformis]|uniref:adenosylmethionine decarboxylase n=1 Tax=Trichostrongylus colubriformis TaxID=6319 RepID=A0AAN8F2B4_TRICO